MKVLIWDVELQPNRHPMLGASNLVQIWLVSIHILQISIGHQQNTEFALAMCPTKPFVLSGGLSSIFLVPF
ncbi:hypothetical protein BHE74_00047717 [Ensete ventricosum]|nr:hypothetical protein GW17_00020288 [Ensete ventricosum]RWW46360.1 hypothetical protein BHE74_00047717 [Ensete ventricosum]